MLRRSTHIGNLLSMRRSTHIGKWVRRRWSTRIGKWVGRMWSYPITGNWLGMKTKHAGRRIIWVVVHSAVMEIRIVQVGLGGSHLSRLEGHFRTLECRRVAKRMLGRSRKNCAWWLISCDLMRLGAI